MHDRQILGAKELNIFPWNTTQWPCQIASMVFSIWSPSLQLWGEYFPCILILFLLLLIPCQERAFLNRTKTCHLKFRLQTIKTNSPLFPSTDLPLFFFWSSKHLSLILFIFLRLLTSSLIQRFCLDPRETTRVLSLNGLFCTSLTNCVNWECVLLQ